MKQIDIRRIVAEVVQQTKEGKYSDFAITETAVAKLSYLND